MGYNTYMHINVTRKPMYNYLKQTKMSIFFDKNREQEGRTDPVFGFATRGGKRLWGEGIGG
jgi:hypothetical protein